MPIFLQQEAVNLGLQLRAPESGVCPHPTLGSLLILVIDSLRHLEGWAWPLSEAVAAAQWPKVSVHWASADPQTPTLPQGWSQRALNQLCSQQGRLASFVTLRPKGLARRQCTVHLIWPPHWPSPTSPAWH